MSTSDVMTPTDAELLTQFIGNRDDATFRELVQRHGSLVMGICRQILRHQHDADDDRHRPRDQRRQQPS